MNASIFIFTLCLLLFLGKWIIIAILFPFQCANGAYQKNKGNFLLRVLAAPYNKIEGIIFQFCVGGNNQLIKAITAPKSKFLHFQYIIRDMEYCRHIHTAKRKFSY